jgi:hypothetical protein
VEANLLVGRKQKGRKDKGKAGAFMQGNPLTKFNEFEAFLPPRKLRKKKKKRTGAVSGMAQPDGNF